MSNKYPVVLCHGLFGWGKKEMSVGYWGTATEVDSAGLSVFEGSVGPVSSFHDRACELAAQIKGVRVDYGKEHAADFGHDQYSDDFTGKGFHADWSEDNPVHLVGHSAGAHTILRLQYLLAKDYWGWGSNQNWVKSIITISGVLNGSTVPYMLGCSKTTGLISKSSAADFLLKFVKYMSMLTNGSFDSIYDWDLDQWDLRRKPGESIEEFMIRLDHSEFGKNKDNLGFDLTLQGCYEANQVIKTYEDTFYFSYVTEQTTKGWLRDKSYYPDVEMNPALYITSAYIGRAKDFSTPPIPGWGSGDLMIEKWLENDGLVSSISQRYPFTAGNHPVHGNGIYRLPSFQPGGWYWEKVQDQNSRSWDHGDVVFAVSSEPSLIKEQKRFYSSLYEHIASLESTKMKT